MAEAKITSMLRLKTYLIFRFPVPFLNSASCSETATLAGLGLVGESTLAWNDTVLGTLLNTSLAAVWGGIDAVTAGCHVVSTLGE